MALSKTTQDHDEIRQWAESRGGKPAEVASTEQSGDTGIIRIMFPSAPHHNDSSLKEISWDEFFAKFDKSGLALVYQEHTADGQPSDFNKLIHPENASRSSSTDTSETDSGSGNGSRRAAKKTGSAKKATATRSIVKKTGSRQPSAGAARKAPAKQGKKAPAKAAKKAPAKASRGSVKGASRTTASKKTAKKAPATRAAAKKTPAKKAPAKKASAKKAVAKKPGRSTRGR